MATPLTASTHVYMLPLLQPNSATRSLADACFSLLSLCLRLPLFSNSMFLAMLSHLADVVGAMKP